MPSVDEPRRQASSLLPAQHRPVTSLPAGKMISRCTRCCESTSSSRLHHRKGLINRVGRSGAAMVQALAARRGRHRRAASHAALAMRRAQGMQPAAAVTVYQGAGGP